MFPETLPRGWGFPFLRRLDLRVWGPTMTRGGWMSGRRMWVRRRLAAGALGGAVALAAACQDGSDGVSPGANGAELVWMI